MIETVNSFLLSVDKFMFEMHLRKPAFMYTTGGSFTKKKKKRIQKFEEAGGSGYIYQNQVDEACF